MSLLVSSILNFESPIYQTFLYCFPKNTSEILNCVKRDQIRMTPQLKPIKIWGDSGINPPKVYIIFSELDLPYEVIRVPLADIKKPEYVAINPNGRLPAIYDPNTGITLWETGAIIEYLIERYDTKHLLSFPPGTPESYHAKQWLFFQASGQGPYFGQLAWFLLFHAEKIPSAIERYAKEAGRIIGVLDSYLAKQRREHANSVGSDGPWLVGDKLSYADLSFILWQTTLWKVTKREEIDLNNYPEAKEWFDKMQSREKVKAVLDNTKPLG